MAILVLNRNNSEKKKLDLNLEEMSINGKEKITDVYSKEKIHSLKGQIPLEIMPHACIFMLVEKEKKKSKSSAQILAN